MNNRRRLIVAVWTILSMTAAAADYPARPVTLIVPQSPGGTNDFVARVIARKLGENTGQQFVVDNRPGAGGNIGTQIAARAPRDGYTLLVTISSTHAINPSLYRSVPFDPVRDFEPITLIATVPYLLVAHPSVPAKSVKELIALARARPGQLSYASAGNGTLNHLLGEMLKSMTGIDMVHIPYKGVAAALADMLGGHVPLGFASMPSVLTQVKEGKLRALGISTAERSSAAPDIPPIGDTVKGYDADLWVALYAFAGTPREIITKMHAEMLKALASRDLKELMATQGAQIVAGTPEQLAATLTNDLAKWARVVKASGATVD
jgi:tripartite-type tricarboxylate transporter receptor subunit TctC